MTSASESQPDQGESLITLLRAMAKGTLFQAGKHDIILNAAADEIERLKFMLRNNLVSPYVPGRYQSCAAENDCDQEEGA